MSAAATSTSTTTTAVSASPVTFRGIVIRAFGYALALVVLGGGLSGLLGILSSISAEAVSKNGTAGAVAVAVPATTNCDSNWQTPNRHE
jgi:hypothetical protein